MQHVRPGGQRDVGPVVHRQQRAVPPARAGPQLQGGEFGARFQDLVSQLNDVYTAGQRRVGELGQIAAIGPSVGTQVQPRVGEPGPDLRAVHGQTVSR